MLNQIKKFVLDESGLETVEWAIVAGVIVGGVTALFFLIGGNAVNGLMSLNASTSVIPAP